jgi:SAM-dependent methyltransferase
MELYREEWGAELYDSYVGLDDVSFWESAAQEAGTTALELGCGTGRLLIPLARAGLHVTGLDITPAMLAVARRKATCETSEVRECVRLAEGDMTDFSLGRRFDFIYLPSRNLQALLTRDQQRSCLKCCAAHLAPNGRLAIDVFNPALWRLVTDGPIEERVTEFTGPGGVAVRQGGYTTYDLADQSLLSIFRFEWPQADGTTTVRERPVPLHYFFRFEMEWMLEACGFEIEALYGGFDRSQFTAESAEMIFVARLHKGAPR